MNRSLRSALAPLIHRIHRIQRAGALLTSNGRLETFINKQILHIRPCLHAHIAFILREMAHSSHLKVCTCLKLACYLQQRHLVQSGAVHHHRLRLIGWSRLKLHSMFPIKANKETGARTTVLIHWSLRSVSEVWVSLGQTATQTCYPPKCRGSVGGVKGLGWHRLQRHQAWVGVQPRPK